MKKTKLIPLIILSALFFGTIGSAIAYQEYLYRWSDDGDGDTHGGCHGSAGTEASTIGTLELSINETGNLTPLQAFTLEVIIKNFTEATVDPYTRTSQNITRGRVTLGVPGYLGDNAKFTSALSDQTLNRGERLDEWGSYDPTNNNNKFVLFAPNEAGTYDLWAVVIAGMNQTDMSAANLTYIEDSIPITVVAPNGGGGDGGTIAGDVLLITVGSAFIVTIIVVIKKKYKISEDRK